MIEKIETVYCVLGRDDDTEYMPVDPNGYRAVFVSLKEVHKFIEKGFPFAGPIHIVEYKRNKIIKSFMPFDENGFIE